LPVKGLVKKGSKGGEAMPLTKTQLAEIKDNLDKGERAAKDAAIDIATARRAGIDVGDMEKELRDVKERLRRMKAVYR